MENNSWSKTVLESYRYLPRVAYTYDKVIRTKACYSAYYDEYNAYNNVTSIVEFIIEMSERKKNLINLKLIIEKALKEIDSKYSRILILRFIDGKKFCELSEILNITMRTLFRRINLALKSFTLALMRLGYNSKKLYSLFCVENWIMDIYQNYNTKEDMTFAESTNFKKNVKKNIVTQLKKMVLTT